MWIRIYSYEKSYIQCTHTNTDIYIQLRKGIHTIHPQHTGKFGYTYSYGKLYMQYTHNTHANMDIHTATKKVYIHNTPTAPTQIPTYFHTNVHAYTSTSCIFIHTRRVQEKYMHLPRGCCAFVMQPTLSRNNYHVRDFT